MKIVKKNKPIIIKTIPYTREIIDIDSDSDGQTDKIIDFFYQEGERENALKSIMDEIKE